jgi:hypothetical protein
MNVKRYSAAEIMGVPTGKTIEKTRESSLFRMKVYGIWGQEVPVDLVDITPPYWNNTKYRYYLSRQDGPVTVDLIAVDDNLRQLNEIHYEDGDTRKFVSKLALKSVIIPTNQTGFMIAGNNPLHPKREFIHELIVAE